MTPLPKYFAVSNTLLGTLAASHFVRRDRTGKSAPKEEPIRMTKMERMRRERWASSPPPELQFNVELVVSSSGETLDML